MIVAPSSFDREVAARLIQDELSQQLAAAVVPSDCEVSPHRQLAQIVACKTKLRLGIVACIKMPHRCSLQSCDSSMHL